MALARPQPIPGGRRHTWRNVAATVGSVLAPLVVFGILDRGGLPLAEKASGGGIAIALLLVAIRRPALSIGVALVFVPLQTTVLAFLYLHGAPAGLVRAGSYVKDGAVLAVVLAAALHRRELAERLGHRLTPRRVDSLDLFAVAYLAIATAYLLIPFVAPGSLGGQSRTVRLTAWRTDCLFIVLMLATRRVAISPASMKRLRATVLCLAIVMLGFGLYEYFDSTAFNNFLVHRIDLPSYQINILHGSPPLHEDYVGKTVNAGLTTLRVGSLFENPLVLAFYMVLPFAYGLERLSTAGFRPLALAGAAAGAVSVMLTETRAGILSAAIAAALLLWLNQRRRTPARFQVAALMAAALVLCLPLIAHTTAIKRFADPFSTNNGDNQSHVSALYHGVGTLQTHPAGLGLGANPATGQRFNTGNNTDTENSYLQVGAELGIAGMLAFIGMYLALIRMLWRRAKREDEGGRLAAAGWLAGCGLLIGGLFLQVWIDFNVSLTFWALAGITLYRYGERTSIETPVTDPAFGR